MVFRAAGFITSFLERYADSGKADKKRRKQKHYNKHTTIWEQRLPRVRSGCRDDTAIVHATAQAHALLFSKLPLEIRQLIYSYVFCGNHFELRLARDKIEDSKTKPFKLMCPAAQQLFGFPGSCRLAYKEVARLIHDSNTFYFQDITAFFCFQRLLPPHYFLAIRSIHLRWAHAWDVKHFLDGVPPSNLEAWGSCWRQIAEMKGLESINVVIALGVPEYEEYFFEPLVDVARTVRVKVNVAWKGDGTKEWPFAVSRGVEGLF
ncbi:hypothetical protein GQ44DRAFT_246249 [Phaeosphaeriaceae sp. PMI808]|nr:hypothetical protein GQ44DRAFT_246249 [Phaeosphaeriaceae sp. PMI808]